jgi:multidrug efflux pump subunit AcrA (membrane-fusion protein)
VRTVGRVVVDERRLHRATTKIGGWVESLAVDFEGSFVERGRPMLEIYSPELVASQEEYLLAKANAARFLASSIPEVRRGGDDLIEAARRRLLLFDVPESRIDELDRTRKPRRTVELVAPATGHVVAKSVVAGMRVEPGQELYTVADLSRVWVEADFYESEAPLVGVGTEARLSLPYDRSVSVAARAAWVDPRLDAEARTLRVRFDVPNSGLRFKPGMFVDVEAEVDSEPGLIVPDSAVLDSGTRAVVFVETAEGRFEPREVEVLARFGGAVRLAPGVVTEGERVVVRANFLLDSESRLRAALAGMDDPAARRDPTEPHAGGGSPP